MMYVFTTAVIFQVKPLSPSYITGEGEEWVQVELSEIDPLWKLPYLWYDFIVSDGDVSVHFIIIDTEALGQRVSKIQWTESYISVYMCVCVCVCVCVCKIDR